jgi:hypothetical protein
MSFLNPGIFGPGYFNKEFDEILSLMPEGSQKDYMQGICAKLNLATRNPESIQKLGVFLDEIDRRRNLNWRQVFPWLEKEI